MMGVQYYVYELKDDERDTPRRVSWGGWREVTEYLQDQGLDADGRMARQLEYREARKVADQTAQVDDEIEAVYVAPLPDLRGALVMFGLVTADADYIVSPVELTWLLAQAVNGWEAALTFSVERIGGKSSEGYFQEQEA